jgi:GNAT superfamily N-acetyltransferase
MPVIIRRVRELRADLYDLVSEGTAQGFRFLARLVEDWQSGRNRFAGPGEGLWSAGTAGRVVGIGGLNADPFSADPGVGRLRHLYVVAAFRGRGIGRALVSRVLVEAQGRFQIIRLRTNEPGASAFYSALGFRPWPGGQDATHYLDLQGLSQLKVGPARTNPRPTSPPRPEPLDC